MKVRRIIVSAALFATGYASAALSGALASPPAAPDHEGPVVCSVAEDSELFDCATGFSLRYDGWWGGWYR